MVEVGYFHIPSDDHQVIEIKQCTEEEEEEDSLQLTYAYFVFFFFQGWRRARAGHFIWSGEEGGQRDGHSSLSAVPSCVQLRRLSPGL